MKPLWNVETFLCRSDNFGVLVHDPETRQHRLDRRARRSRPILAALAPRGWNAHPYLHHPPPYRPCRGQSGAEEAVSACQIIGPDGEAAQIPGIDKTTAARATVRFRRPPGRGHRDARPYAPAISATTLPDDKLLFAADTLFALGCGRLFEGTPADDVAFAAEACGAAGRHDRLFRPRIHAVQRPFRR